jgi:putative transposase
MPSRLVQSLNALLRKPKFAILEMQVAFLVALVRILLAKQRRPSFSKADRRTLVHLGAPLGADLKPVLRGVTWATFQRWGRDLKHPAVPKKKPKGPGRPRTRPDLHATIIRLATENNLWGIKRIHGELKKLGFRKNISRTNIRNVLLEADIPIQPDRPESPWTTFLERHASTLYACDFLQVKTVTSFLTNATFYVLVFVHIGTRRIHFAGITTNPDGRWMAQQARNFGMRVQDAHPDAPRNVEPPFSDDAVENAEDVLKQLDARPGKVVLLRDRDKLYTRKFSEIIGADGIKDFPVTRGSPDLNAFAETVNASVRRELLNHFVVFSEKHLRHLLSEYERYYNTVRPHQGIGNVPLAPVAPPPETKGELRVTTWLGGLLKHYSFEDAAAA